MSTVRRVKTILADPSAEWVRIEKESGDPAFLLSRYVAVLALIPAVFGFAGASLVGATVSGLGPGLGPGIGPVRAALFDGAFGAIFGYAMAFGIVLVLAAIIDLSAPLFGGQKDFDNALKLAVYSYTPVWLAGIFLLLPGLRFLILLGFYGAYVLAMGLPRLMKSPPQRSHVYVLVSVVAAVALTLIAAALQRAVFGTAGL